MSCSIYVVYLTRRSVKPLTIRWHSTWARIADSMSFKRFRYLIVCLIFDWRWKIVNFYLYFWSIRFDSIWIDLIRFDLIRFSSAFFAFGNDENKNNNKMLRCAIWFWNRGEPTIRPPSTECDVVLTRNVARFSTKLLLCKLDFSLTIGSTQKTVVCALKSHDQLNGVSFPKTKFLGERFNGRRRERCVELSEREGKERLSLRESGSSALVCVSMCVCVYKCVCVSNDRLRLVGAWIIINWWMMKWKFLVLIVIELKFSLITEWDRKRDFRQWSED